MIEKKTILSFASAAVLTLALQQGAWAETTAEAAPGAEAAEQVPAPAEPATAAAEAAIATEAPVAAEAPAEAETVTQTPAEAPAEAETVTQTPAADARAERAAALRERMDQRQGEMMAERRRHYEELRARAAAAGLDLPETPPWEQAGMPQPPAMGEMPQPPTMPEMPPMGEMPQPPAMPEMPGMPEMPAMAMPHGMPGAAGGESGPSAGMPMGRRGMMTPEERDAVREQHYQAMRERAQGMGIELPETPPWKLMSPEERDVHREVMRMLTPEDRQRMREQHWAEMRERAAAQGIEMPETPPWKQAEQRRQEMKERWESYRRTVEAMSEEQREAAAAVFGEAPAVPQMPQMHQMPQMPQVQQMPRMQQMPQMPMGGPSYGGVPQGSMPGFGGPQRMPQGPMPGYGGTQGAPWSGSPQGLQGPPPPETGYGRPW